MKNEGKLNSACMHCAGEIEVPQESVEKVIECPHCFNLTVLFGEEVKDGECRRNPSNRSLLLIRKAISPSSQNYWLEEIIPTLDELIIKTHDRIIPRLGNFGLKRQIAYSPIQQRTFFSVDENAIERALLNEWGIQCGKRCSKPVADCWSSIICNQVSLQPGSISNHIARADLLAITSDGLPVVIELKSEWNSSALLSVFLQALEYAIRTKLCWNHLLRELREVLPDGLLAQLKSEPACFVAVCAAPSTFWARALNPRRPISWEKIYLLRQMLICRGFRIHFVSLSIGNTANNQCRVAAREIEFTESNLRALQLRAERKSRRRATHVQPVPFSRTKNQPLSGIEQDPEKLVGQENLIYVPDVESRWVIKRSLRQEEVAIEDVVDALYFLHALRNVLSEKQFVTFYSLVVGWTQQELRTASGLSGAASTIERIRRVFHLKAKAVGMSFSELRRIVQVIAKLDIPWICFFPKGIPIRRNG